MSALKKIFHKSSPTGSPTTSPRTSMDANSPSSPTQASSRTFNPTTQQPTSPRTNAYSVPSSVTGTSSTPVADQFSRMTTTQQETIPQRDSSLPFPAKSNAPTIPPKSPRDQPIERMSTSAVNQVASPPSNNSRSIAGHAPAQSAGGMAGLGLGSSLNEDISKIASHDHKTLAPVIQETHHHHETEYVERVRNVEKHIHHVQHRMYIITIN